MSAKKQQIFASRKKLRDQNLKTNFRKGIFLLNLAQSSRTWIHLHFGNNIWKKKYFVIKWRPKGVDQSSWRLVTCNNYVKTTIPDTAMITMFDLYWPSTSMKVIIILNLYHGFFWPSLVVIFDLHEGHHLSKLALAILLTKFDSHRAKLTALELCWPLTSMKITIIPSFRQGFFGPSLVVIEHCLTFSRDLGHQIHSFIELPPAIFVGCPNSVTVRIKVQE